MRKVTKKKTSRVKRWLKKARAVVIQQWNERRGAWSGAFGTAAAIGLAIVLWPSRSIDVATYAAEDPRPIPTHSEMLSDPLQQGPWEFFHPVWRDEDSWFTLPTSLDEHTGLRDYVDQLNQIVGDPKARIEPAFRVPDFLKARVVFWMLVHTRYSRKIRIVHDRNDPGVIYGYLDFRPLYRVLGPSAALESRANKIEKAVIKGIREKLAEAAGLSSHRTLSPKEREQIHLFLSRHGALGKQRIASLGSAIRTQTGQSDEFVAALSRSRSLLPHIEAVFRQKGLPIALGRIPFVESSFNDVAHSKVGAMGIWQFMPSTAAELISRSKRERWADPVWQTRGATRLFTMYRSVLPDWGTTVTSYNSGVGRVRRLVEKHRLRGIEGLLALPEPDNLGFAGQNFYAQFLSANLVEAYKDDLFITIIPSQEVASVLRGTTPFPKEVCEGKEKVN